MSSLDCAIHRRSQTIGPKLYHLTEMDHFNIEKTFFVVEIDLKGFIWRVDNSIGHDDSKLQGGQG